MVFSSPTLMNPASGEEEYVPTTISDAWVIFEADRGITVDGSNGVSAWADQTENGFNVSQSTESYRPLYVASGMNGLPVVRGNISGSDYLYSGTISGLAGEPELTCVMVSAYADERYPCILEFENQSFGIMADQGSSHYQWCLGCSGSGCTASFNYGNLDTDPHVWIIHMDYDGDALNVWIDGTELTGETWGSNIPQTVNSTSYFNLFRRTAGTNYASNDLAFLGIYLKEFTSNDRSTMNTYLGDKYGITIS